MAVPFSLLRIAKSTGTSHCAGHHFCKRRAKIEVMPDEIYVQVNFREYDKKGGGKIDIETIKNNFLAACKSLGSG